MIQIQEFLNFIDTETKFGKLHVAGDVLFLRFVEFKRLDANTAYVFRLRLKHFGF
jgi:hypothetical protein